MKSNQDDFEKVLAEFGPGLWRLAGSFEFDHDRREDLYQDMLVAIWRALPRLQQADRLQAYVYRTARNRAVNHIAGQVRQPPTDGLDRELPGSGACPFSSAEQDERSLRLRAAVNSLPLAQRETVSLFFEGLSHAEIAEVLGISENNVAVRINRARAQLTESLST